MEAAFALPVLFVVMLMLIQPGIVLYDRMVMRAAAADACRVLATRTNGAGFDDARYSALVKRHLGAVPGHELFHVHEPACTWEIRFNGGEDSSQVSVEIANTIRLLPLLDAAGAFAGIADANGQIRISVTEVALTQPTWVDSGRLGRNPGAWVSDRG